MAAAAERIFEFLDAPEEEPDHATARTADVECNVQFDHVRFGYDPEKPVIKDFSAQVSEGQTVALVGPTGAGKTTDLAEKLPSSVRRAGDDVRPASLEA